MPFIFRKRRNVDRLLALILLWNVVAGAFVTLGAPWLADIAGTTGLRPSTVLPAGAGWLAIGVPTHFAGIWLSAVGVYALQRMRRRSRWHPVAVLFYAPQIVAITSPEHFDARVGLFAMTPYESAAVAVNWIAIALFLAHSGCALWDSRFREPLAGVPRVMLRLAHDFWGAMPLSRAALSRRFASVATLAALVFLPLVPAGVIDPSRLLVLPITFIAAYALAYVWSGDHREPRFSARRGVATALLTYVYLAMTADWLSRGLFDGREPVFRLFVIAWIYLQPWMLTLPVIGALTGAWLGKGTRVAEEGGRRLITGAMWVTLAIPLVALLISYHAPRSLL